MTCYSGYQHPNVRLHFNGYLRGTEVLHEQWLKTSDSVLLMPAYPRVIDFDEKNI